MNADLEHRENSQSLTVYKTRQQVVSYSRSMITQYDVTKKYSLVKVTGTYPQFDGEPSHLIKP